MYKYMRGLSNSDRNNVIRKAYYTALGRERWGAYSVNNNSDNIITMIEDITN